MCCHLQSGFAYLGKPDDNRVEMRIVAPSRYERMSERPTGPLSLSLHFHRGPKKKKIFQKKRVLWQIELQFIHENNHFTRRFILTIIVTIISHFLSTTCLFVFFDVDLCVRKPQKPRLSSCFQEFIIIISSNTAVVCSDFYCVFLATD